MSPQEPSTNKLGDSATPEERLASVLAEELHLQKFWLETSNKAEKRKYQARLKSLIKTKLALELEIKTASQLQEMHDNLIPGEELALLLTEGLRARKIRPKTSKQEQQQGQPEQEQRKQQSEDGLTVEDSVTVYSSPELLQEDDGEELYESSSAELFEESRKEKTFLLWILLLVIAGAGLFVSQNPAYIQALFPVPELIPDQKIGKQLSIQAKAQSQSQDQIRLLEGEIGKLSDRLIKKEKDLKTSLEASSKEVEELIGKKEYKEASLKLAEQQAVYDLSQRVITRNDALINLQNKKAEVDQLIKREEYETAIQELSNIKEGYQYLLANLDKAKPMYLANNETLKNQKEWLDFKQRHELGALEIESNANALRWRAKVERDAGQLAMALDDFQKATDAYHNLLTDPEVKEAIAAKYRQPIIAKIKEEMIKIPFGSFQMGDLSNEGDINEYPVHKVIISPFLLKKTEVTFEQYDIFADATGRARPNDNGWGRGDRPVINVNWHDAVAYTEWLSKETGEQFRLPTEAEWEYAARAGRVSIYSWGDDPDSHQANGNEEFGWPSDGYIKQTAPVASFNANDFGLYDMHGNVQEWTQDCWIFNYERASIAGKAMTEGDCKKRVLRGGSWADSPSMLRSSKRGWSDQNVKSSISGFRLAQDLKPSTKIKPETTQNGSSASE